MPMQIRRTATPNLPPTTLSEGQLAVEMANPARPSLWVGVPAGIDASGRRLVNVLAYTGTTPPASAQPGDLWWDDVGGTLYVRFDDGTTAQWVGMPAGAAGPQGPQGNPGTPGLNGGIFPDVAVPGVFMREAGDWVPMTTMTARMATDTATAATLVDAVSINVGTAGSWLVMANLTLTGGVAFWGFARLWDGTTVIDQAEGPTNAGWIVNIALRGVITNPAAALRVSGGSSPVGATMLASFATGGAMLGTVGPTSITAVRIG